MIRTEDWIPSSAVAGERGSYAIPEQLAKYSYHRRWTTIVYRAYRVDSGQETPVAIKEYQVTKEQRRQFDLEAEVERLFVLGRRLNHPSIVATLDRVEKRMLVFEWAGSVQLQKLIAGEIKLEHRTKLAVCRHIIHALRHIYRSAPAEDQERFWGYGDLHPYNIMLTAEAGSTVAKLIDLDNIGRLKCDISKRAPVKPGTIFSYESPEVLLQQIEHPDDRSDIFSLGMIMYRVLFGSWPYKNVDDYFQLIQAVLARKPLAIKDISDSEQISQNQGAHLAEIYRVVSTMLTPYRTDRYTSFEEISRDFDHACSI